MKTRSFLDRCIDTLVGDKKFTKNYNFCVEIINKAEWDLRWNSPLPEIKSLVKKANMYYQKMKTILKRYSPDPIISRPNFEYKRCLKRIRRDIAELESSLAGAIV